MSNQQNWDERRKQQLEEQLDVCQTLRARIKAASGQLTGESLLNMTEALEIVAQQEEHSMEELRKLSSDE